MPASITGMKPSELAGLAPAPQMPTVAPMPHPGNMPGGAPIPQPMPQMAQPGATPPEFIGEDQGNGTILLRATNPDGSPGPVVKIIPSPSGKGLGTPKGQVPKPAVSMQGSGSAPAGMPQ